MCDALDETEHSDVVSYKSDLRALRRVIEISADSEALVSYCVVSAYWSGSTLSAYDIKVNLGYRSSYMRIMRKQIQASVDSEAADQTAYPCSMIGELLSSLVTLWDRTIHESKQCNSQVRLHGCACWSRATLSQNMSESAFYFHGPAIVYVSSTNWSTRFLLGQQI